MGWGRVWGETEILLQEYSVAFTKLDYFSHPLVLASSFGMFSHKKWKGNAEMYRIPYAIYFISATIR